MADVFTKSKRAMVMSQIRGRGNKATEIALAKIFRANHITGWGRHRPVFGKPDFIFPKSKLAVFMDACFWHGCPRHGTQPKGNAAFWRRKFLRNKLRKAGWRVLRIWEHALRRATKDARHENKIVHQLQQALF